MMDARHLIAIVAVFCIGFGVTGMSPRRGPRDENIGMTTFQRFCAGVEVAGVALLILVCTRNFW